MPKNFLLLILLTSKNASNHVESPGNQYPNQIDYILISSLENFVLNSRSYPDANIRTFMEQAMLLFKPRFAKNNSQETMSVKVSQLSQTEGFRTVDTFQAELLKNLCKIKNNISGIMDK